MKKQHLLLAILALAGCSTTKFYQIEVVSEPPGAHIEVDNDYIGTAPLFLKWQSTGPYISGYNRTVTATPVSGGYVQTKIFRRSSKMPKKIYFNTNLKPGTAQEVIPDKERIPDMPKPQKKKPWYDASNNLQELNRNYYPPYGWMDKKKVVSVNIARLFIAESTFLQNAGLDYVSKFEYVLSQKIESGVSDLEMHQFLTAFFEGDPALNTHEETFTVLIEQTFDYLKRQGTLPDA